MRVKLFYHSLVSDWKHGNAHFLRGIVSELLSHGHNVEVFEPADSWSYRNLVAEHGEAPVRAFQERFPQLRSTRFDPKALDTNAVLDGAELTIVHEWNDPELVGRIGEQHARHGSGILFFHDTHHRSVPNPEAMARYDLSNYDGVLANGATLRRIYLDRRLTRRAWTWHEAADVSVFKPIANIEKQGDLVWIGNRGDDERSAELNEFLLEPVRKLGLRARVYGVRYPPAAIEALQQAGIEYRGWLPNHEVPSVFAQYRVTVHVPRRRYATPLPGVPTIRVFEALACGIPLVSAPWNDSEELFTAGKDFLMARNGDEMTTQLKTVLENPELAAELAEHGRHTILHRHTCAHRVGQLMEICNEVTTMKAASTPA